MKRLFLVAAMIALLGISIRFIAPPVYASQNSLLITDGSGTQVITDPQSYINKAIDTLATHDSGPSAPSSPKTWSFWFNTTANIMEIYNGTSWIPMDPRAPVVTKTASYSITAADLNQPMEYNSSSAGTFTLLSAATAGTGSWQKFMNAGSGTLTLGGTVNGVTNPTLGQNGTAWIVSDSSGWHGFWTGSAGGLATLDGNGRLTQTANTIWNGTTNVSPTATPAANASPLSGSNNRLATGWDSLRPAIYVYSSASYTVTYQTATKVPLNTESFDTNSNFDNTTNYRFTPTVSGYYWCQGSLGIYNYGGSPSNPPNGQAALYFDGSVVQGSVSDEFNTPPPISQGFSGIGATVPYSAQYHTTPVIIYFNGSTDYVELWGAVQYATGTTKQFYGYPDNGAAPPPTKLYCVRVSN